MTKIGLELENFCQGCEVVICSCLGVLVVLISGSISGKAKVVLDDVSLDAITVQFWMVYKASSYSLLLSHSILKPKYWPVVAGDSVPSEIVTHTANCEEIFV